MSTVEIVSPLVECADALEGSGPPGATVRLVLSITGERSREIPMASVRIGDGGEFELPVPDDGPVTCQGDRIGFAWSLRRDDSNESYPVVVLPRGGLAMWMRAQSVASD